MAEKFKLPANLVEQVSKEGMSKVLGGGNLIDHINNGKNCDEINSRLGCRRHATLRW